jgi:flagellar transcriptional activator FlhC
MASRSVVLEAREITLAIELIELGGRLQVLEAEVGLSRERLIKLYKEVRGVSPPKGMLPFSTDWFMTWQPNIHSSLFYNTYRFMVDEAKCSPIQATIRAYRLYLEHVGMQGGEAVLGLTRAWTLLRFFDSGMLQAAPCGRCGGRFVTHAHEPRHGMVCGLCQPPSRAGKTRASSAARAHAATADLLGTAEAAYALAVPCAHASEYTLVPERRVAARAPRRSTRAVPAVPSECDLQPSA